MKVLSLREPYATLVAKNIKTIETRSFNTKYRGTLYIHASKTKIPKSYYEYKELMDLASNYSYSYGKIICKCKLVDSILMTEEFVKKIKEEDPINYICGDYQVGRYAWILEDIEELDEKIDAKGNLGIWNYNK